MKSNSFLSVISVLFLLSTLSAQNHKDLFEYYKNKELDKLATRLNELEKSNSNDSEILFFRTIFIDNGEESIQIYQKLFNESDGPLKNLAAEKISDYFFAKGFYIKAAEYEKYANTFFPIKTKAVNKNADNYSEKKNEITRKPEFVIQVGAFSVIKNAQDLAQFLRGKKILADVVERRVGENNLFCVWIKGKENFKATEKLAKEIKKHYKLSYRIIKQ